MKCRARGEIQRPGMTIQVYASGKRQTPSGRLAQRVRNSVIVIEQAIRRAQRAVVYLDINIRLCISLMLSIFKRYSNMIDPCFFPILATAFTLFIAVCTGLNLR